MFRKESRRVGICKRYIRKGNEASGYIGVSKYKSNFKKDSLALKGGTAINLTIFNLPRLSVDIDLDYLITNSREEMLESRAVINSAIDRYMVSKGYSKNPKTKNPHSLDSWIYDYMGVSRNKENIKIEINYSLRYTIGQSN
ncbi:MAG: nucleotidyl transferase AbiEii/AbiGii toxin family protein [Clostridiales bacterium]|nr:nucleotidyl transferase AbiEii/AbiGii toxin family protein [Clostridiales bacterium]